MSGDRRREHDRVLRSAPTLADLDGGSDIRQGRVAETTGYRGLDGKSGRDQTESVVPSPHLYGKRSP
jgi:hypothetical protein